MKKSTQRWLSIIAFALLFSACSKSYDPQPQPQPPATDRPIKVTMDGVVSDISYNADGSIKTITTSGLPGAPNTVRQFTYENGKLKEVDLGGKWKYTYTGNNLTRIEAFNSTGQIRNLYDFNYNGNQLTEEVEYVVSTMWPRFKTLFYYRPDGNIEHIERFLYVNNAWKEAEQAYFLEYDTHPNNIDEFVSDPYLPVSVLTPNNSLHEKWYANGQLTQEVTHVYTYNTSGKTLTRKTTFQSPGVPPFVYNIGLIY